MKKKNFFLLFLLVGILFFSFNIHAYFSSGGVAQYTQPTTSIGYLNDQGISLSSGFDENTCNTGSDFILQVSPLGCSPTVVRSDMLEEQNYPVFCSISATKINPLIDVNAINSISFSGKYPDSVSGIGYHPARAAIKNSDETLLNSPILENIGYVVVVLKQNKNESSMPDFVSGNLTATLKYDIENAFGIGQVTYYLPELSDSEWATQYSKYSFWQGRGYLRATGIEANDARISVYSDKNNRISSADLSKGESSKETFLSGFYCTASLQTRLDGLVNPNTRARLNINGEITEVSEGETFLDGKCVLKSVEKEGLVQRVNINCKADEGSGKFNLLVSPKIKISYNGKENEYLVGDKVEGASLGEKSVYVGYVGRTSKNTPYAVLVAYPPASSDEFRANSWLYQKLPSLMKSAGEPGEKRISSFAKSWISSLGTSGIYAIKGEYIVGIKCQEGSDEKTCNEDGENLGIRDSLKEAISQVDHEKLLDQISFKNFASPSDVSISASGDTSYYKNAINDYKRIFTQFPNEEVEGDPTHVAGENALYQGILLSERLLQYSQMLELCNLFEGAYPDSDYKPILDEKCQDRYKMSNSQISSKSIFINGDVKQISLEGVYDPSFEDYGVILSVKKDGKNFASSPFTLTKDSTVLVPLDEEDTIFQYSGLLQNDIYLQYVNDGWYAAEDYSQFLSFSNLASTGSIALGGAILLGGPAGVGIAAGTEAIQQYLTKNGLPLGLLSGLNDLEADLYNQDFEQGKEVLLGKYSKSVKIMPVSPLSIELSEIKDEEHAVINLGLGALNSLSGARTSDSIKQSMTLGVPVNIGNYEFTIDKINLQRVAKVSVIPNIKKTDTSANFSFNIGIEKRAIQLSPTQIKNRISDLDKNIQQWEGLSENLGNVVEGFKGACLGIGAAVTVKNFFTNLDGSGVARREVMNSAGGWNNICAKKVKDGEFTSVNNCLLSNNDAIERDISFYVSGTSSSGINEKTIGGSLSGLYSNLPLEYKQNYPELETIFTSESYNNCASVKISQAREIERLSSILANPSASDELKEMSNINLKSALDSVKSSSEECEEIRSGANQFGFSVSDVAVNRNIEGYKEFLYSGKVYSDLKGGLNNKLFREEVSKDNKVTKTEFEDDTPIQIVLQPGFGDVIVILQRSISGDYTVLDNRGGDSKNIYIYNPKGELLTSQDVVNEIKRLSFRKENIYSNSIINPEVSYFETSPYKGAPAIVPFRTSEGWYVATRQLISAGGQIRTYDDSGAASSFYICNVGPNKQIEFFSSKMDDCQLFTPGVGVKTQAFFDLSEVEANQLIADATSALQQASEQYLESTEKNSITIKTSKSSERISVGAPSTGTPEMQCQNFMSPKDCLVLFNACDPVICPSSRCNLGGAYTVSNVIQSGIVGSTLLCLPNIKEKIAVPVCLTGVKAGMDGVISLFQNYRDCLQTSLDTGQTVGICDELHSIYLCEMFWRQTIPFAELGVPKLLEAIMGAGQGERGGGEYLSVKDAWDTADNSLQYISQFYGAGSYSAFKVRATEQIGSAACKGFVSATYPSGGDLLDTLLGSDSPTQYYGWFDEITLTTATVPPTIMYKVFYHVYAGKDSGAYYSVYLSSPESSSYYKNNPTVGVDSGYIAPGKYASETKEIIAPAGYKDLCISVNGQTQCGFKKSTTDFGANYLEEMYVASQADDRDIKTEADCVSGTNSMYSLANLNVQEGVDNLINPEIYNHGLIRVCATNNPGKGTDANWNNPQTQRWKEVGYCDNDNVLCWLDTESVETTLKSTSLINQSIGEITKEQLDSILEEGVKTGEYINLDKAYRDKLNSLTDEQKISTIDETLIDKAFYSIWKAYLLMTRGNAYSSLARITYEPFIDELVSESTDIPSDTLGTCKTVMEGALDQIIIPQKQSELNPVFGAHFPVEKNSIEKINWNFGNSRSSGARCHAGIDIYTKGDGNVIAMDEGVIINKYPFYKNSYALIIQHTTSDGKKYVVNYGEMDANSISNLKIGDKVNSGQKLGTANSIGMLHFELYKSGTTKNEPWYPLSGNSVKSTQNWCWENIDKTNFPGDLFNPTNTLEYLYKKDISGIPSYDSVVETSDLEGIGDSNTGVGTGNSILNFEITGEVVSSSVSRCEDCGETCTLEECESIANSLNKQCKFSDNSGNEFVVGIGQLLVTGSPTITGNALASSFEKYDFTVSNSGKKVELRTKSSSTFTTDTATFEWEDSPGPWVLQNIIHNNPLSNYYDTARTGVGPTPISKIDRPGLNLNSEIIEFAKELRTKTLKDFENGKKPIDTSKYSYEVLNNGAEIKFTSKDSHWYRINDVSFEFIPNYYPWLISFPFVSLTYSDFPISLFEKDALFSNQMFAVNDEVYEFADILKTKTPDQMNSLSTTPTNQLSSSVDSPQVVCAANTQYDSVIDSISQNKNIDPSLLKSIIYTESRFDSSAVSKAGAVGLMQFMPDTAVYYGLCKGGSCSEYDYRTDAQRSILAGSLFLKDLFAKYKNKNSNDVEKFVLAAYNYGETKLNKECGGISSFDDCKGNLPSETQEYVEKVLDAKQYCTIV